MMIQKRLKSCRRWVSKSINMPFLIDKTYIEDKFQAYIQSKVKPLGYECVIEPYDGPTYQQFVGILVSQDEYIGDESIFNEEIEGTYTEYLKTETRFSVRVTVWGGDAWDTAKRIEKIFRMSEALADFWTDMGSSGSDDVQYVPTEFKGKIQQIATVTLYCYANMMYHDESDYFDKINIGVKDFDGNVDANLDVDGSEVEDDSTV